MKTTLRLLSLTTIFSNCVFAGTGAVFPDPSHLVRSGDKSLNVYSVEDKKETKLQWPAESKFAFPAIAAAKGTLLVAGGSTVSRYDPVAKTWTPLWLAPEGETVDDVAYDVKNDTTVVLTGDENGAITWWIFAGDSKIPDKLFNRRAGGASDPVFNANGDLFYTVAGDLWKGSIKAVDAKEVPFILNGERIWPLALRETGEGNSSSSSAKQIIPMEKWIILELSRSGGSGWGNIIRVPNANAYKSHLPLKWDELEKCESGCDTAISADGKNSYVYIRGEGKWFQINGDTGVLVPLPMK